MRAFSGRALGAVLSLAWAGGLLAFSVVVRLSCRALREQAQSVWAGARG